MWCGAYIAPERSPLEVFALGCAVVFAIVALVGVAILVYLALAISGMMKDAVPSGGSFTTATISPTPTMSGSDCEATKRGGTPPPVNADLWFCSLANVNLTHAQLASAILIGADLKGANLTGANLTGANLTGANLTGANLTGVVWLNTTCPDGPNSDSHGKTCIGHGA